MRYLLPLLLLLGTSFFLSRCGQESNTPEPVSTIDSLPTEPKDTIQRIRLAFVGDVMGHGDQIKSAYDPKRETYDYDPSFRYIRPILEEADIAFANLEVTLSDKGIYRGYPLFRSPDTLAKALKTAGFDYLVTANNHSNDNGLYGVVHTLDVLDRLGLGHTGTFRSSNERDSLYPALLTYKKGDAEFRFSILNYSYGTNGMPTKAPSVVNVIDEEQILKDIKAAQKQNPDLIMAFMHWGHEYHLDEYHTQQELTKLLWENGVDVVIGAHPHVMQPIKTDTLLDDQNQSRPVLVAYSLGNFISNQFRPNTDMGLLFELDLEKDLRTGKVQMVNHDYVFVWRHIKYKGRKGYRKYDWEHIAVPISAFEGDTTNHLLLDNRDEKRIVRTLRRLREHMGKWESEERRFSFEEIVPEEELKTDSTEAVM